MKSALRTPPLPLPTTRPLSFIVYLFFLLGGGAPPPLFSTSSSSSSSSSLLFVSAGIQKTNPCAQVPTLICQHGSYCTPGNANFGPEHEHLQLQTSESGYHCDCSPGYIGHECQVSVDKCTGGGWGGGGNSNNEEEGSVPFCYHGAQCQIHKGKYYCDCHTLNLHSSSTAIKYAGSVCQHPSTSFCATSLDTNHAPNFQYCTNDGTCNRWVSDGEDHPGCSCLDGYSGDRCEIQMNDPYAIYSAQYNNANGGGGGGKSAARTAGIVFLVLAIVILIPVIVCLVMRARRRKRRNNLTTATSEGGAVVFVDGKTVVGEGDLDADGSGTLGSSMNNNHDEKKEEEEVRESNGEEDGAHHDGDHDGKFTLDDEDDKQDDDDDAKDGEVKNGHAASSLTEIV